MLIMVDGGDEKKRNFYQAEKKKNPKTFFLHVFEGWKCLVSNNKKIIIK